MTVTEMQEAIKQLSPTDQDRLAGFLGALRKMRDPAYRAALKERREDDSADAWISLEEMKRRLGRS